MLAMRQERKKQGFTIEYVGKKIGITKSSLANIETGRKSPSYKVVCNLEDFYNIPHRQLFALIDGEKSVLTE